MQTHLEVEISNDPITGLKRKLVHHRFIIETNLEMVHYRKLVHFEKIDNGTPEGAYGRPILQVIAENETLTPEAKRKLAEQYEPQVYGVDTSGVWVNPATGQPVQKDAEGNYPEGSVQELAFWQSLPISFIQPPPTTNAEVVYGLMKISMKASDNAGRV